MEIPVEIKSTQQLHAWQAVNQCKGRMEQIAVNGKAQIAGAPPQLQQVIFQQMVMEMKHLASVVINIRSNCQHTAKTWRDVDQEIVVDISQCVICQLYL